MRVRSNRSVYYNSQRHLLKTPSLNRVACHLVLQCNRIRHPSLYNRAGRAGRWSNTNTPHRALSSLCHIHKASLSIRSSVYLISGRASHEYICRTRPAIRPAELYTSNPPPPTIASTRRIDPLPYPILAEGKNPYCSRTVWAFPKMEKPIRGLFPPVWVFPMSRYRAGDLLDTNRRCTEGAGGGGAGGGGGGGNRQELRFF